MAQGNQNIDAALLDVGVKPLYGSSLDILECWMKVQEASDGSARGSLGALAIVVFDFGIKKTTKVGGCEDLELIDLLRFIGVQWCWCWKEGGW